VDPSQVGQPAGRQLNSQRGQQEAGYAHSLARPARFQAPITRTTS
jgi:hypothetical protein